MTNQKLEHIAGLIEEGKTSGVNPNWKIQINYKSFVDSFKTEIEYIAECVRDGCVIGSEPMWEIDIEIETDFYDNYDEATVIEINNNIATVEFEKGEIYSVVINLSTYEILDVILNCNDSIKEYCSETDLKGIQSAIYLDSDIQEELQELLNN